MGKHNVPLWPSVLCLSQLFETLTHNCSSLASTAVLYRLALAIRQTNISAIIRSSLVPTHYQRPPAVTLTRSSRAPRKSNGINAKQVCSARSTTSTSACLYGYRVKVSVTTFADRRNWLRTMHSYYVTAVTKLLSTKKNMCNSIFLCVRTQTLIFVDAKGTYLQK